MVRDALRRARASLRGTVGRNTIALAWVHIATLVLPVIALPFLARQLGPSALGLVVFAQALSGGLLLLLDYGFGLSATRDIARTPDKPERIAEVVDQVVSAKLLLALGAAVVTGIATLAVETLRENPEYALFAWLGGVAASAYPLWYFQGLERLRVVARLEIAARLLATAAIFALIREPSDAWLALALPAAADILGAAVANAMMYRNVRFARPRLGVAARALRDGARFFLYNVSVSLYTAMNAFILGLVSTAAQVAFFGGAERGARAGSRFSAPFSGAIYPRITQLLASGQRQAATRLAGMSLVGLGLGGCVLGGLLALAADPIIALLLGPGFEPAVPVLRLLSLLVPLIAISNVLAIQWALPLGLDRPVVNLLLATGPLNVALLLLLGPPHGAMGAAVAIVISETVVVVGLAVLLFRRGLLPLPVPPAAPAGEAPRTDEPQSRSAI